METTLEGLTQVYNGLVKVTLVEESRRRSGGELESRVMLDGSVFTVWIKTLAKYTVDLALDDEFELVLTRKEIAADSAPAVGEE